MTSNTSTNSTINNTVTSNKKSDIKIEILNGSGNSKKLQKAVSELEGAGYKVTRTGTTNSTSKTTIIDKRCKQYFITKHERSIRYRGYTK